MYLIVWMHFSNVNVMTVQYAPLMSCGEMRETMAAQPGVDHAMCAASPATITKYVEKGDCIVSEERNAFINFTCTKGAPTWPK